MNYYEEIKRTINSRLDDVVFKESDGVLNLIISVNSMNITMNIQGYGSPELDLQFKNIKRYHSSGSVDDMVKFINALIDDVQVLRRYKGEVEFKQRRWVGIFPRGWKIVNPADLKVLS